ncbi:MAG: lasR [Cereibacter sp.]|nr:lasR [Cereibacter sp.]
MQQLREAVDSAIKWLGFSSFNISLDKRTVVEFIKNPTLTTWADSDLEQYLRDSWADRDPLLSQIDRDDSAFLWHVEDWRDHEDYYDYICSFGLCGGMSIPLHRAPERRGAMILMSKSEKPLTLDTLMGAKILAHMVMARAANLSVKASGSGGKRQRLSLLSQRQREILHWVAQGKTNREIAMIIGSTRRTIDYHMQEILSKLEVPSRTTAVVALLGAEPSSSRSRRQP